MPTAVPAVAVAAATSATLGAPAGDVGGGSRQVCQDLVTKLMLDNNAEEQNDVRTRVMSYLTYIDGLQVCGWA